MMIQVTLNTGAKYSLIGIIRGTVTAGVTTTGIRPGQTVNVDRFSIQADPANAANNVAYGDASIATDGSTGRRLTAGLSDMYQATPRPTLNRYVAVTANGTKFCVEWE